MNKYLNKSISFIFIILLFFNCNNTTDSELENPQNEINAVISVISGNGQKGSGGSQLNDPVIIQVSDIEENPLADVNVDIGIVEGGGSVVEGPNINTNSEGRVTIHWRIGSGYNGIEVKMGEESKLASPCYVYAEGETPAGIHITRSIASFKNIGNALYEITIHGDYSSETDYIGQGRSVSQDNYFCSLFSVFGDPSNYIVGRSFDNPAGWDCLTLITRVDPNDGYASISPVRMRDIGFHPGNEIDLLPFSSKTNLIGAVLNPPDGINESGLIVALANVTPRSYIRDPEKTDISCVRMVRNILDHGRTIEEAAEIAKSYNITSSDPETLDIHAIVADATGRSAILEPGDGEMRFIRGMGDFQVATNSPVYNTSISSQLDQCWRFRMIYELLASVNGALSTSGAIDLLESVGNQWTEWSAVYNMNLKSITIAINFNFDPLYNFYISPQD